MRFSPKTQTTSPQTIYTHTFEGKVGAAHTAKSLAEYHIGDRGVTPKQYLNDNERILYEARPNLIYIVKLPLLAAVVLASIVLLPTAVLVRSVASGAVSGIILMVWLFAAIAPLLVRIARWRTTFYTLTDQRILHGKGVASKDVESVTIQRATGLLDVKTARITGVSMTIPFAGRLFGYGNIDFTTTVSPVNWQGVKHPADVRRYVEETLTQYQEAAGRQLIYSDEAIRTVAGIDVQKQMGYLPQQAPYQATGAPSAPGLPPAQQATSPPISPGQQQAGNCSKCGKSYIVGTKFCSQCGSPIVEAPPTPPEEIEA